MALIDQSSFSKFEVTGAGAHAALERIAVNRVPAAPGHVVYTQLCNEAGGIEADLTIIHVASDHFMVVTGSGFGVRDWNWIERQFAGVTDVAMRGRVERLCHDQSVRAEGA